MDYQIYRTVETIHISKPKQTARDGATCPVLFCPVADNDGHLLRGKHKQNIREKMIFFREKVLFFREKVLFFGT